MSRRTIGDSGGPSPEQRLKNSCPPGPETQPEFAEVVNLYGGRIQRLVMGFLGPDADVVKDAQQEIWLKAWKSVCQFRGTREGDARKWIESIARNHCRDALKCMKRERAYRSDIDPGDERITSTSTSWETEHVWRSDIERTIARLWAEDPQSARLIHVIYVEGWTLDRLVREFPFPNLYQARNAVTSARRAFKRLYGKDV